MTEKSYGWTTDATGDGTSGGYTQTDFSNIFEIVSACFGYNGVAANYLNVLAPSSTGVNNARIATGGALVDGKPYKNDANVDKTITSAVGGGNTRIDRVVARADWSAQTVRITVIAGTDAASPTAPAITQTSGTTYDIKICQVLVDTSGNITITDERDWARVNNNEFRQAAGLSLIGRTANSTGDVADITASSDGQILRRSGTSIGFGTIANAGLGTNIVDDTNIGNRVPMIPKRQGGSSTNWATSGTTDYTPTAIKQYIGVASVSGATTVTFPAAFSYTPSVMVSPLHATTTCFAFLKTISTTQFTVNVKDLAGSDVGCDIHWIATGTE